ncbi:MAG: PKD domain-containing protein [Methanoregula sp.]|nr:PKD domain-containing protein [Methanoregula sp.]
MTVTALSPPVASFTTNVTSGTVPLVVLFNDTSTNSPTTWVWTFGDSSYSTIKNPVHTYSTEGTHSVSLTATNSGGSNTVTMNDFITVEAAEEPVASFTTNATSGAVPLVILFNDTSTNYPTSWTWTFGDGDEASTRNTTHEYTEEGTYTVTLTATNSGGSDTVTQSEYITVEAAKKPVASFTTNVTSGAAPLSVLFNDTSTHYPTYWKWSFGDGNVSYTQNTTHKYMEAGTYTIKLIARNDEGTGTITETSYITVESEPVASFTSDARSGTAPLSVEFKDTSTNYPTSWTWTFGDGDVSSTQNATHMYTTAGYYTVSLVVSNDAGSDSVTQSQYITVSSAMTPTISTTRATVAEVTTTVPATTVQETLIASNVTGSGAEDGSLSTLIVRGGIILVVISIIVLFMVKRGRGRSQNRDL